MVTVDTGAGDPGKHTPKVSRFSSSFHVFIDQKKRGKGHTISDSSSTQS